VPMDEPDDLVAKIEKAAPGLDVKVVDHGISFFTEPDNPYLKSFRETALAALKRDPGSMRKHAASDARHFTEQGIPALVFGPGGANIHGRGEWVDLRQVAQFYKVLEAYADSL
jgi:succinyl-diaminopimelate desuccinylase